MLDIIQSVSLWLEHHVASTNMDAIARPIKKRPRRTTQRNSRDADITLSLDSITWRFGNFAGLIY